MLLLGKERHADRVRRAREHAQESTTPAGAHLLRKAVATLSKALEAWVANAKNKRGRKATATGYLEILSPEVVALVTAKAVIDNICRAQKLTSAAIQLGDYLEDEAKLNHYFKLDPLHYNIVLEKAQRLGVNKPRLKSHMDGSMAARNIEWKRWPQADRLLLGVTCIETLAQETGLIELQPKRDRRGKTQIHIVPAQATLDWLEKAHEQNAALFPFYLPCIAVPKDWKGPYEGGYHTNTFLQKPLVKSRDRAYQRELADVEMPSVYAAVNAVQRSAWEVNTVVAEVLRHFWQEGVEIGGLPNRSELPIPDKPKDIATNEIARREWRKNARHTVEKNLQAKSSRVQLVKILFMADKYQDIGRFWFPYTADFRGRLYPVPYFLQPQGPDEARGMLRFADGVALGEQGEFWLAVHGANCWGEDKIPFADRAKWVTDHEKEIVEVGEDPITNRWWAEAERPWSMLAFCLEWWALVNHKAAGEPASTFESHTPVAMDGSNNGLQIFSLLLRDPVSGAATNCTPQDVPADIYQDIADALTLKLVQQQTQGNEQERGWATKWLQFVGGRVPRKACKRPVMVVPYGGTLYSAQQYLMEWYDSCVAGGAEAVWPFDKFNPTMYLSRLLWQAIQENIHSARACMDWLQEVADICTEHGVPIRWTSPAGFPVKQSYRKFQSRTIKTRVGESVRYLSVRSDMKDLSSRRQRNGVSPNFVHSLDAACLHKVVERLHEEGVRDFAMIHDSYAVHARYVPQLNKATREVYRDVFSEDLLGAFRAEVLAHLPSGVDLPEPPALGSLQVEELVSADYFFS